MTRAPELIRARRGRRAPRTGVVLLVAAALLAAAAGGQARPVESSSPERASFAIVGPQEVVFDWSVEACEPIDIPDAPANAFRDARGRVQLLASHYVSRRALGPTLDAVRHTCDVVMRSHERANPSAFDDREWISATYTTNGRTVFAIVHMEYQGNTHPGRCRSGDYFRCWWNTLNLAVSLDGGRSFRHASPPRQLVASSIRRYQPDSGVLGVFAPSNIVRHRDGYHYALFTQHIGEDVPGLTGTCVMRTRYLGRPESWRAWDGSAFSVRFADPYRRRTTFDNACTPLPQNALWGWNVSLTFNSHLGRYVVVGTDEDTDPETGRRKGWLTITTSRDLVHWAPRRRVLGVELPSTWEDGDVPAIAHVSVLDPRSSSRNFRSVGRRAYLYFTKFNDFGYDRDLVRVPIEFSNG